MNPVRTQRVLSDVSASKAHKIRARRKFSIVEIKYRAHAATVEETCQHLEVSVTDGITTAESERRLLRYGPNELKGDSDNGLLTLVKSLLVNLFNLMNVILMVTAIGATVLKEYVEAAVLYAVILVNATVGFVQEYKSERTMEALRQISSPVAVVIRDGTLKEIESQKVVRGDLVQLKTGDVVCADIRLVETLHLEVDEALLTGESEPVAKFTGAIDCIDGVAADLIPLSERKNMIYRGTVVTKGRAKGIVIATGIDSEIGRIAKAVTSEGQSKKLGVSKDISKMMFALLGIAFLLAILVIAVNGMVINKQVIAYAVAVAIALLPEGLPTVMTVTMALGVRKMAKQNAIIRRVAALEELGRVTNICSDKTGTLTQGKMVLKEMWIGGSEYIVDGIGIIPEGSVRDITGGKNVTLDSEHLPSTFLHASMVASMCNAARLTKDNNNEWKATGDPTEIALQVYAHKVGIERKFKVLLELPFDSTIKRMSVLVQESDEFALMLTKGSVNSVLDCCAMDYDNEPIVRSEIIKQMQGMASKGLRVLALAIARVPTSSLTNGMTIKHRSFLEQKLTFLGLVGIYDPPRPDSLKAVRKCHLTGIEVHMVTGDHWSTATSIAKEIGILPYDYNPNGKERLVWTAAEFEALSDQEIDRLAYLPNVLALCSPETKVKFVRALHRRNKIVGMTGDGVNDAPAIKCADIGISMGINGSEVTRQVSDITLADDNFATIINAVAQGRSIFANIKKFVGHFIACNIAIVVPLLFGLILKDSDGNSIYPLSPLQILFLNMITSSPIAISLGMDPPNSDLMIQPPRSSGVFTRELIADTLFCGLVMGALTLGNFVVAAGNLSSSGCNSYMPTGCESIYKARSCAFLSLCFMLFLNGFIYRSSRKTLLRRGIFKNKSLIIAVLIGIAVAIPAVYIQALDRYFLHQPISIHWIDIFVAVLIYFVASELYKLIKRRVQPSENIYTAAGMEMKRQNSKMGTSRCRKLSLRPDDIEHGREMQWFNTQ